MTKFIFVTGGVVSSLGKGITAASLGRLLKDRGLKVFMQKFDPYINIDPGTMSPYQHGEVFVTDDGAETDLDLGHYERFIDESLTKDANITTGKIYQAVINKERNGEYLGRTVQVIPHITNEIKDKLLQVAKDSQADVVITEIGGTVGDIESLPFLEAARQMRRDIGFHNTCYIHNTLVPYLRVAGEIKTKPTQHSVKELRSLGINPDIIVLRTEVPINEDVKDKIALFCDVDKEAVIESRDEEILYEVVLSLHNQGLDQYVCKHLQLETKEIDLSQWSKLIQNIKNSDKEVTIALVGKYVQLKDAYLSVSESLKHAGAHYRANVNIKWIDAEVLDDDNITEFLGDVDGILVPGGFGIRAINGKIKAIKYARENRIPFLGICLGMQLAIIEYARNVANLSQATSTEFEPNTPHPIIEHLPNQDSLRLGLQECEIKENTLAYNAYQKQYIKERHRHRYGFNNQYKIILEEKGMIFSGINPHTNLVEIIELDNHPFFIACQFHPEFISRPNRPHPLFSEFIASAIKKINKK
ncbi:MAG TPA: CTP synthase [Haloplasmataceae bacterium]